MTILGKVMLFFVLILSLAWAGLTVNVYVTRTNWANEAKRWQEKAKEAEQSAQYQRKLAEETRTAAAAREAAMQSRIAALQTSVDQLTQETAQAKQQLDAKLAVQQQAIPPDQLLQANIARLEKQVDILQTTNSEMERQLSDQTVASEKAKADALRAQIDRDAALKARDDLEVTVLNLNDQLGEIRRGGRAGSSRLDPPDDFRASVTKVEGDLVAISLGLNAKLQKGATLSVYRTKPNAKYIGTITIIQVDPFGAVGRFSPPAGVTRPSGDDLPREGDTVGVVNS
jgi:hypothetical protein